jgi:hypothetical protein
MGRAAAIKLVAIALIAGGIALPAWAPAPLYAAGVRADPAAAEEADRRSNPTGERASRTETEAGTRSRPGGDKGSARSSADSRQRPADGYKGFPSGCLPRSEAIAAVVGGRAIPLGQARRVAERAGRGEMISADLCPRNSQGQGGMQYVVTVLGASGKVSYAAIDASSGRLIWVR